MKVTTTLNRLHFEDLEPHRFEDLVRQLAYDFRSWERIEAVGRAGSDEGADIIAVEAALREFGSSSEDGDLGGQGRLWVIQCKREKTIPPKRLATYVRKSLSGRSNVHGFLLAAACDFSAKARAAFRAAVSEAGVTESHLWGKAELEDRLFLPANDHLLFAYFHVSLQTRRRSQQSELARRLALKRRLVSEFPFDGSATFEFALVRNVAAESYPFVRDWEAFKRAPQWMFYELLGHHPPDNLRFIVHRCIGWVDWDTGKWDISTENLLQSAGGYWLYGYRDEWERMTLPDEQSIPSEQRANITIYRDLPYNRILAFDEVGDAYNRGPHILVERSEETGLFGYGVLVGATRDDSRTTHWLRPEDRKAYFSRGEGPPRSGAG